MKIKYMAILLILLCFLIGAASAADDGTVDSLDAAQDDAVSIDAVEESDEVASTEPTSTQTDEKLEQSTDEILKTGTKTVEVNNFNELTNTINGAVKDGENDTYVINLNPGTYSISKATTLSAGTNTPNIIINGNGQSLTGTRQLTINSGCNIVLNNLTISPQVISSNNNITLNKVVLNNVFTNKMNLYITNSHLNAKIFNGGTLTIDENTTATTKFAIDGGKLYINNNPDIINILQANYVFYNDYSLANVAIYNQVVNYAHLQIENVTFSNTITNYGEMNIINGTRSSSGRIINSGNLTLANSSLPYSTYLMPETNYGNLKFINSTIGCSINNYGNVTIDDDCIIQPAFALEYMEGSNVYYSDMDKISCYRKTFDGNYTIRNMNFDVAQRKNTGILYFINCTLTGNSLTNTGELYIINSTSTAVISIEQEGIATVENTTLDGTIYVQKQLNSQAQYVMGTLVIGDNVTYLSNLEIVNTGYVICNNSEVTIYLKNIEGTHSFNNVTIIKAKTNNGDLTLTNSTVNAAITNNGNLTIINSTVTAIITNNDGILTIINSTIKGFTDSYSATNSIMTIINSTITSSNAINNKGTLTIINSTKLPAIYNYGKLIIPLDDNKSDAELFQNSFSISQTGTVETNNINRLFKYMTQFTSETTIELGVYTGVIINYGNLTIENSTLSMFGNLPDATMVLKNTTLTADIENYGTLYLNNATINCNIINYGILIISDDTILGPNFQLNGAGEVISNKTELIDYVTTYYGNAVLNNKIITSNKVNEGTLTLNNCTINAVITNNGRIIVDDNTVFGDNTQILGEGEIVINDMKRLLPYVSIIKGNHIITDASLTKTYKFYGTITLKNCTITSLDNMNYATLYLNNCTVDVGEDNTFLTNVKTVYVSKDTNINGKINDLVNDVIYEGAPQTYVINQATIPYYFENNGILSSLINPGDTLDIQGRIILNRSLIINKAVNIISTTKDGYIDLNTTAGDYFGSSQGNVFAIHKEGAYTNITGVYFHNTQLWLHNTNHVTLDGISVVVENQRIGSGVGVTSIRANSSYITVKNSYFHTTENEGSSTLVLAWADYCTIENNTIEGDGMVGNLLYLTTYNVNIPENIVYNSHNKLINNRLRGPETPMSICWGICISGFDNLVANNTINYRGDGIMFQWGSGVTGIEQDECLFGSGENIVCNNTLYGGCGIRAGDVIYNNYMEGALHVPGNAIAYNNTASGLSIGPNSKITNNTISGKVTCNPGAKDVILENNTIKGDIEIPSLVTNVTLMGNNIIGSVTLDGSFNNLTNNRIITNGEYAVSSNKLGKNNTLEGNYLVANGKVGNDAVSLRDPSNVIASAGVVTKVEVSVPGEVTVNKTVQVTIKLTDANGNPLDGQVTVSSALGSETVNVTKGTGVYQYTPKAIGEDTISVKFAGNDTFYLSSNSSNVNVIAEKAPAQQNETKTPTKTPAKTVVSLSFVKAPKKVSKKAKKLILSAKLKINGKLAKGKKLTFKFKGKTFKVKTNKKGVAKLTIKSKVLKKLLKKVKAGKKVKYQVSYGKKTVKKTLKVKK